MRQDNFINCGLNGIYSERWLKGKSLSAGFEACGRGLVLFFAVVFRNNEEKVRFLQRLFKYTIES